MGDPLKGQSVAELGKMGSVKSNTKLGRLDENEKLKGATGGEGKAAEALLGAPPVAADGVADDARRWTEDRREVQGDVVTRIDTGATLQVYGKAGERENCGQRNSLHEKVHKLTW